MRDSRPFILRCLLALSLASAFIATNAHAQYNAGIEGTVSDASGAVIGGASVQITNQDTNIAKTVSTGTDGFYQISGLPPGKYTVAVTFSGFKSTSVKDVEVTAESVKGLNVTMEPGEVIQTVNVKGESAPPIETENGTLSGTLSKEEIQSLPQYGRDPYELVRLTPGVFGDGSRQANGNSNLLPNTAGPGGSNTSIFQTENMVQISSAGQRISDNNFTLDGVSANSLTWGGAAVVSPNQDSIQEIKVVTNGYDAEYGRNSGVTVQVISKTGTNKFHGSGFFKYDDPGLNAFNKYNGENGGVPNPTVRVPDATRQFGGSLGGPIKKDKLFFFFSYEGLRDNKSDVANEYVFTPQYVQSVIGQRAGGVTAQIFQNKGFQPRIIQVLTPSCSVGFSANLCQVAGNGLDLGSLSGGIGTYVNDFNTSTGGGFDGIPDIELAQVAVPSNTKGNQYNGRIDFTPTSKDTFAVSTYVSSLNSIAADASTGSQPMADVNFQPLNSVTTVLWNRTISPYLLNQARANVTRYAFNQVQSNAGQVNWGIPRVEVQGFPFGRIYFGAMQSPNEPGIQAENTIAFNDTLSQAHGNKTFKYGVDIIKEQSNNNLLGAARPDIVFQYLWDLPNDAPIFEQIQASPVTGAPTSAQRYFRTSDYSLFLQTDWKLRPNFTLNMGLRWEYFTPLTEKNGELSNIVFPSGGGLAGAKVEPTSQLYNSDKHSFGPRLGFAYSPTMFANKLVIRGGFGVFFNRLPEQVFDNTRQNPPFTADYGICCGTSGSPYVNGQIIYALGSSNSPTSYPANPNLATGIDPNTGTPPGVGVQVYGALPNTPNPYVEEGSLGFEYSLAHNWVAAANVEVSGGHKIGRLLNLNYLYPQPVAPNPLQPGQTYQPFSNGIFVLIPDVNSAYDGLNTRLSHQFAHDLFAQFTYRYSKSIDESSWEGPCFCTNETFPQNLKSERGPSDFDVTHYFTATAIYQLPWLKGRHDLLGRTLGGWELDPIITAHSGFPWTPVDGQSVQTPGGPTLAPTRPVAEIGTPLNDHSNDAFIRPGGDFPNGPLSYFAIQPSGPPGIGRNSFRGPHYFGTDLSFAKNTRLPEALHLGEAANLEIRANFFNVFNKMNLAPFGFSSNSTFLGNPGNPPTANSNFGLASAGLAGRVIEFQARVSF
ncbi:MAG TPA: carboxypeptidase regulatory-like domain-containing protein [Terriglobia bacterium]|nr:carboxypeptidase regulatory-like domain-containing protein [Terriglobia bacterium]